MKPGQIFPVDYIKEFCESLARDHDLLEKEMESINLSDIYKESELPKISPHWPGVGRYIGVVDDDKPVLFTHKGFNCFDYWDKQPWQKNRVYNDEILLKPTIDYSNRPRNSKSVPEIMYNLQRDLDRKLIKFINGEK